jgi:cytoskeletal protein CcmA (bactofilin family)
MAPPDRRSCARVAQARARWRMLAAGALGALLLLPPAQAARDDDDTTIVIGGDARVRDPAPADVYVVGGNAAVDAPVAGDLVSVGGNVTVDGDVAGSVIAVGGNAEVNGRVGRHVRLAGGDLRVGPGAEIGGSLGLAGGQMVIDGTVHGQVKVGGGSLRIDGRIDGDVRATAGEVMLGPRASIGGRLHLRSGQALQRAAGAVVAGGIVREGWFGVDSEGRPLGGGDFDPSFGRLWVSGFGLVSTLLLMGLAALLIGLLPRLSAGFSRHLRQRTGASLLLGLALLAGVPLVAVLLAVTVIGIPFAVALILLYLLALPLAYVAGAVGLGDWLLQRGGGASEPAPRGRRIAVACAMLGVVAVLVGLPVIGGLLALVLIWLGLGAIGWRLLRGDPQPAT